MKRQNKRVKNATECSYNGIEFKSKLEMNAYRKMETYGIHPQYEGHKYIIWEGFKPQQPFFEPDKNKNLVQKKSKVLDITYTPDFMFYHNGYHIIIETKGFSTPEFLIKRKLFRKYIEQMPNVIYFEVHNMKQIDQAMSIIKSL